MSSPRTRPRASRIEIFSTPRIGVDSNTTRCASCSCVRASITSVAFTVSPSSVRLPGPDVHKRPTLLTEGFDLICNLVITLRRGRVGIEHRKRLSGIGLNHHIGIEWNSPEERHAHVHRRSFPTAFSKYLDVGVTMGTL